MATLRVVDAQTGTPLRGVRVSVRPGIPPEVTTDDAGNATVLLIPLFPTRVTVSRPGLPDQVSTLSPSFLPGSTLRVLISPPISAPPAVVPRPVGAPSVSISLQQQSGRQSEELFSLRALIREQQGREDRLRDDLQDASDRLQREEDEREAAEERAEDERRLLQDLLDAIRDGLDVSQEELRLARERIAQADRDAEEARRREEDARDQVDGLAAQIEGLTSAISDLTNQVGNLEGQLLSTQEELERSREEQVSALEEQRRILERAFQDALDQQLQEQAEEFRRQLEELERQIEEERRDREDQVISLEAVVTATPRRAQRGDPVLISIRIF